MAQDPGLERVNLPGRAADTDGSCGRARAWWWAGRRAIRAPLIPIRRHQQSGERPVAFQYDSHAGRTRQRVVAKTFEVAEAREAGAALGDRKVYDRRSTWCSMARENPNPDYYGDDRNGDNL